MRRIQSKWEFLKSGFQKVTFVHTEINLQLIRSRKNNLKHAKRNRKINHISPTPSAPESPFF